MCFELLKTDSQTQARRGCLTTTHGKIQTPIFMPVGTVGSVKTMTPAELKTENAQIILGNTYHLNLRPGMDIMEKAGGLHRFMGWDRPILTDSGGFQVFSLSKLRKITQDGVHFQSHIDGSSLFLGPRESMEIQRIIGSDIAMLFDECIPYPSTWNEVKKSLDLTLHWAKICKEQPRAPGQLYFGIIQGGFYKDLRELATSSLIDLDFDGYSIGGMSVGEPEADMFKALDWAVPLMPEHKPRYLMGVGTPLQIVESVARGVDMFDCVLPTRVARNGTAYTKDGTLPVKAGRFKDDFRPIEQNCQCYACQNFSRAYIRHLLNAGEILGARLMTIHNIHFYLHLMEDIRLHIEQNTFNDFRVDFVQRYHNNQARTL